MAYFNFSKVLRFLGIEQPAFLLNFKGMNRCLLFDFQWSFDMPWLVCKTFVFLLRQNSRVGRLRAVKKPEFQSHFCHVISWSKSGPIFNTYKMKGLEKGLSILTFWDKFDWNNWSRLRSDCAERSWLRGRSGLSFLCCLLARLCDTGPFFLRLCKTRILTHTSCED